jgi:diguanylate cyclase
MFKDFIANASLLITSFFIMGQIFNSKPLRHTSPFSTKLYWGLAYGVLGNILMLYSIKLSVTTIADLRHLAIVLAAAFGGYIPAITASVLIALGRIVFFDITSAAIYASIGMLVIGLTAGWISKLHFNPTVKAFTMNLVGLLVVTIVLVINVNDPVVLKNILITHYIISLTGGFIAYHFSVYIAKSNEAIRELSHLSYRDGLTGIYNRRFFDDSIEKEWSKCLGNPSPLTLLMFDLDYFKNYNDTYGHLAGDYCLQTITREINNLIPPESGYTFCRYGGEEFAIILPSTRQEEGEKFAGTLNKTVQLLRIPHSSSKTADIVTLSIGIASMTPYSAGKPQELIQKADSALYHSKSNGRNTISVYI